MPKLFPVDLHYHTILSGHAFNTLLETISAAKKRGIKLLAITEHGPAVGGGPHLNYFRVAYRVPERVNGLEILMGVEANILDTKGTLDIPENLLQLQDIVLAGLHDKLKDEMEYEGETREDHTNAIINAIKNPHVNIIAHPAYSHFPLNLEKVVEAACRHNTLLEINTSYRRIGRDNKETLIKMIKLVKDKKFPVVVNSDAHIIKELDNNYLTKKEMKELGLEEKDILNTSVKRVKSFFKIKGRKIPCFGKTNGSKTCI